MSVAEIIGCAIAKVREGAVTREGSLVITKLQEAIHWQNDNERELREAARRSGVGPSVKDPRANTYQGVTLTEPLDIPPTEPPKS
jgi:hypothetical protein